MKKADYVSPSAEILHLEMSGSILSSSVPEETRPSNNVPQKPEQSNQAVSAKPRKLQMGKLIIIAARPITLFSKVNVSIDDEVVQEITEQGQFVIPITEDCEVKFKWRQALTSKYIDAFANEIKVVRMSYTQTNIKLSETVYARDGVRIEQEDNEGGNSNVGLKIAGTVALGVLAAVLGGDGDVDADFDADFDGDFDFDMDGDGIADSIGLDTDGDGFMDTIATDTDGDGFIDTFTMDTDGDGVFDSIATDTDGDGLLDTFGADTDGDGNLDTFGVDTNADGMIDQVALDSDHDGVLDTIGVDSNFDGNLDAVGVDVDGNGSIDIAGIDVDGDGNIDSIII